MTMIKKLLALALLTIIITPLQALEPTLPETPEQLFCVNTSHLPVEIKPVRIIDIVFLANDDFEKGNYGEARAKCAYVINKLKSFGDGKEEVDISGILTLSGSIEDLHYHQNVFACEIDNADIKAACISVLGAMCSERMRDYIGAAEWYHQAALHFEYNANTNSSACYYFYLAAKNYFHPSTPCYFNALTEIKHGFLTLHKAVNDKDYAMYKDNFIENYLLLCNFGELCEEQLLNLKKPHKKHAREFQQMQIAFENIITLK